MAVQRLIRDVRFEKSDVPIVGFSTSLCSYLARFLHFYSCYDSHITNDFRQITMRSWKYHDMI